MLWDTQVCILLFLRGTQTFTLSVLERYLQADIGCQRDYALEQREFIVQRT